MGYYVYITRRENHYDERGPTIDAVEWQALVDSDPELSFRPNDDPLTAYWSPDGLETDVWFAYSREQGDVETKNPDAIAVGKMLQIAVALGARVQGEDGEIFSIPTESDFEDD